MPTMAGTPFQTNPEHIEFLLDKIGMGELVLPEFQRDFRWAEDRTARLLSSVIARFPTGALLLWSQSASAGAQQPVGRRPVEGAPAIPAPTFRFILDGQQRLTALYRALRGISEEERYFVEIAALLDRETLELKDPDDIDWDAVVVDSTLTRRDIGRLARARAKAREDGADPASVLAEHDQPGYQGRHWRFPVHRLKDFHDWLEEVVDQLPASDDGRATAKAFRNMRDRYLKYLDDYQYPVVTLDQDTSLVAVCRIFETLNKSAVVLGPFELLTAKFFPDEVNLRDLWDAAKTDHAILEEFGVDPYSVLQALTLRTRGDAQRAGVLNKLTADDVKDGWASTAAGMAAAARLLQEDCGVMSSSWLPYQMLLVPLGAIWNEVEAMQGPAQADAKSKLRRYFWCTSFTANFDQGANSQAQADYLALKRWIAGDDTAAPEALGETKPIRVDVLESATTRKTAYFKAVMALLAKTGARDFHEGGQMTPPRVREQVIEAHHVFPKRWLKDQDFESSPDLILNQTPINKSTNASIGAKPPSEYYGTLQSELTQHDLDGVLASHLINAETLKHDDYDEFLAARSGALIDALNDVIHPKVVLFEDVER
jgi:hypothetical protein